MGLTKQIFLNSTVQFSGKIIVLLIGIFTVPITVRYLLPQGFGVITLVNSIVALVAMLSEMGIYTITMKQAAQSKNPDEIFGNALTLRIITTVLFSVIAFFVMPFFYSSKEIINLVAILLFSNLLSTFASQLIALSQLRLKMTGVVVSDVVGRILGLAALIAVVKANQGIYGVGATMVIAASANLAVNVFVCKRYGNVIFRFNLTLIKAMLAQSFVLGIASYLVIIHTKADTFIISALKPIQETGIYGVTLRLRDLIGIFPGIMAGLLIPAISKAAIENKERLFKLTQQTFEVLMLTGIIFGLITIATSPLLISLIGSKQFSSAIIPTQFMGLVFPFLFSLSALGSFFISLSKYKIMILPNLIFTCLNIILNLIFVPHYSYIASSIILVISMFGLWASYVYYSKKQGFILKRKIHLIKQLTLFAVLSVFAYFFAQYISNSGIIYYSAISRIFAWLIVSVGTLFVLLISFVLLKLINFNVIDIRRPKTFVEAFIYH